MDAFHRQDRMRTERGRRKIQAVVNSVEADLDDPESRHHDLNPKNRALFLMKVKREMTEDAAKAGVLLSKADLKPFDKKITEYLMEVKKIKENAIKLEEEELAIKAEKAKKAKEKRERKAARKQLKKETDAVTKIATAERGRQARTLKKRMKQSNKLADLMEKKMDIPDDEDLLYFDESGQLTKRQKELADKMAGRGGKRKRKTRRKRKTKRKKKRKTKRRRRGGMNGSTGGTESTPLPRPSISPGSTGSRNLNDEARRRAEEEERERQRIAQEERRREQQRIMQVMRQENTRRMRIIQAARQARRDALYKEGSSGRGLGGGKRTRRRRRKKRTRKKRGGNVWDLKKEYDNIMNKYDHTIFWIDNAHKGQRAARNIKNIFRGIVGKSKVTKKQQANAKRNEQLKNLKKKAGKICEPVKEKLKKIKENENVARSGQGNLTLELKNGEFVDIEPKNIQDVDRPDWNDWTVKLMNEFEDEKYRLEGEMYKSDLYGVCNIYDKINEILGEDEDKENNPYQGNNISWENQIRI